jgi:hypothetical protein
MKASAVWEKLAITLSVVCLCLGTNVALAEEADGTDGAAVERQFQPQVVEGAPTYQVGYMHSTTSSPRRAMAISITNNSTEHCDTTVKWLAGGGQLIGTSSVVIPAGQTFEHCSRAITGATVVCNAISNPEVAPPQFIEGKADIHLASACQRMANIDAKQYYMTGSDDADIAGVYRAATIVVPAYQGD